MMELVDMLGLGSSSLRVGVQVPFLVFTTNFYLNGHYKSTLQKKIEKKKKTIKQNPCFRKMSSKKRLLYKTCS